MKRVVVQLFLSSALIAQEKYDLLIKNGTVLDPKNNLHEIRDVARAGVAARVPSRMDWRKEAGFHRDQRWRASFWSNAESNQRLV